MNTNELYFSSKSAYDDKTFLYLLVVEDNVWLPYFRYGNANLLHSAEQLWVPRQHNVRPRLCHHITTTNILIICRL